MRHILTGRRRAIVFRKYVCSPQAASVFTRNLDREALRRRSMKLTKNLTTSVGGYLPNTLTEMWEPSRDFAFLKLPVSGARCVVALSGVRKCYIFVNLVLTPSQHNAACDGHLFGGLLLLLQHRPGEWRGMHINEAIQVSVIFFWSSSFD